MDLHFPPLLTSIFLLLLFSLNLELMAAVKVSQASGNWSNSEVWGGSVPAANDDIIISSGTTVNVNILFTVSMTFHNVTIEQGGSLVVGVNDVKLRIKGNIKNDGIINFWQSSTYQADIWLYGNSVWSGTGSWNLSNVNVQGNSLEPAEGLTLTLHGSLTAYAGSSFNKLNKYANITLNIQGDLNTMISSLPDFYYGHLIINKTEGPVSFSPSKSSNMIKLLGNLTLTNSTDSLFVEAFNTLTLLGEVTGAGVIKGSSTSSLVVDNLNAPAINPLRILGGTHFKDFIINRRAGVTLSNGFFIRESLQLNNASILTLPPQTLTLGINGTTPTLGSFSGDGTLIGSTNSSLSIRGKGTETVKLNFDQASVPNYTLYNLIIDRRAGKVAIESGNLNIISRLDISDKNICSIGSGTLIINKIPSFIGSGCLGGSSNAGLMIAGTGGDYSLVFDQLSLFGNSLKSYTQSRNAVITLANKLNISERVNLTGSSSVLVSDGNLTLLSSQDGSAGISSLFNGADVRGDVNVQVYVSGDNKNLKYRGYRSFSTPINDQLVAAGSKKSLAQLKDYIIITGSGGVVNGFDQGGATQPYAQTLLFYNPSALRGQSLFTPIEHINQYLPPGTGFFAFFRGKQSGSYSLNFSKLNSPFVSPEPVTIVYKGIVNKFDIPPVVLHASQDSSDEYRGYNLIGNPYPSAIDWTKTERSPGVNDEVLILKPGGGTATYLNGFSNNGGSPYIQTGQGFYVRTSISGSTVTFKENCKTSSYPARLLSVPIENDLLSRSFSFSGSNKMKSDYEVIRLNMGTGLDKDETTIVFKAGERPEADYNDAIYFGGGDVNLSSLSSDGKRMAISFMPDIHQNDTIKLYVNAVSSGAYMLNFTDVPETVTDIYLKDSYSGDLTLLKKDLLYSFEIDKGNPATFGGKRFSLIFRKGGQEKSTEGRAFIPVYPNPASDEVFFDVSSLPEQNKRLMIFDMQGKIRESGVFKRKEKIIIKVAWLEPGLYVAKFRSEEDGKVLGETLFIKY